MEYFDIDGNILLKCKEKNILIADIPDGVVEIASNAFADCSLLEVHLNNIKKIRDGAFGGCTALKSIDLKGIEVLGDNAFVGCTALECVQFGEKLGYIPNSTFDGCISLEKIVLPENIWYIGQGAFHDCTSLTSVEIQGVMEIDVGAFEGCNKLYSLQLPDSVLHIAPNAFSFCFELRSVTIKNTFIEIDETAFDNTVDLVIKAVQFSTASRHAKDSNIRFVPIIVNECFVKCSVDYVNALKKSGMFFQAKPCSESEIIIRYDKSQEAMIQKIIKGGDKSNGKSE